jgi:hypothetical protein
MKIKSIILIAGVVGLVLVLMLGSFIVGVRYANMQARNAQNEFLSERGADSSQSVKSGVAANPIMQMMHDMVGLGQPQSR